MYFYRQTMAIYNDLGQNKSYHPFYHLPEETNIQLILGLTCIHYRPSVSTFLHSIHLPTNVAQYAHIYEVAMQEWYVFCSPKFTLIWSPTILLFEKVDGHRRSLRLIGHASDVGHLSFMSGVCAYIYTRDRFSNGIFGPSYALRTNESGI